MNATLTDIDAVGFSGPYEQWLLGHLRRVLGLRTEGPVALCWGSEPPSGARAAVVVPKDGQFLNRPQVLKQFSVAGPAAAREGATVRLEADLISWIGWLVSRAEEYGQFVPDRQGRYPRAEAITEKLGLTESPVADLLAGHVRAALEQAAAAAGMKAARQLPWPEGKTFAVAVTHDVDRACRRSLRQGLQKAAGAAVGLLQGKPSQAARRAGEAVGLAFGGKRNPIWLFDAMARLEDRHGFRSAFYLLPNYDPNVREVGRPVRRYSIANPKIREQFHRLAAEGWEIGVHLNYQAHQIPGGIAADWENLRRFMPEGVQPAGGRSHYLLFKAPGTWTEMSQCGMKYDATVGWASGWGFRGGTSWPYVPFDRSADQPIAIWELGTHVMDTHLPGLKAIEDCAAEMLKRVKAVNGCACILVHPAAQNEWRVSQFLQMYENLMGIIASHPDAWVATPAEIVSRMEASRKSMA